MPEGINAVEMSKSQREVSVAEFFEKNKHLLGYENPQKSLLTVVREAVDNALDACEEARILPDVFVEIKKIDEKGERFKLIVEDNGPGIVKANIPKVFGKLLYGSKFHRLRQSRGQQGIGISGAVLYAQLTTGKPTKIYSRIGDKKTHIYELHIDTTKNDPEIVSENTVSGEGHGVRIEMDVKGKYVKGKQSIFEYLRETAIMNPYSKIIFIDPEGEKTHFERVINKLPKEPKEIKPHPAGIELGILLRMLKNTSTRNLNGFLMTEFCKIGSTTANEICMSANIDSKLSPKTITRDEADKLLTAMQTVKIQNPPTDCLSPLGEKALEEGLKKELDPEYVVSVTRSPSVYSGRPFQIEVGIAYGGKIDPQGAASILRFANRVPLLYEQSACAITKSIIQTEWKRYGMQQSGESIPIGPLAFTVNFLSVWVPFTSEGKEAIASYPEVIKEVKLALQEAGRKLGLYLSAKNREKMKAERASIFKRYIPRLAEALADITGEKIEGIEKHFEKLLNEKGLEAIQNGEVENEEENKTKGKGKDEKKEHKKSKKDDDE